MISYGILLLFYNIYIYMNDLECINIMIYTDLCSSKGFWLEESSDLCIWR